mmetsp:Transcript_4146/g.7698  ORF Transcript_4146/g.7698 Transcript_4146/m.7698 type:complete len:397 (-) Transcript_4146:161-1351(-)
MFPSCQSPIDHPDASNKDAMCSFKCAAHDLHNLLPLDLDSMTRPPKRQLDSRAGTHQSGGRAASARSCPRRARKRQPDGTPVTPVFPRFLRTPPLQRRKASTVNHSNQDLDEDDMMSEGNSVLSILTHISRARSDPCSPASSSCSSSLPTVDGLVKFDSVDAVARATSAPNTLVQKHRLSAMCSNSLCSRHDASRTCAACLEHLHCTSETRIKKPLDQTCWTSSSLKSTEVTSLGVAFPTTQGSDTAVSFSSSSASRSHSAPEAVSDAYQNNGLKRSDSNFSSVDVRGRTAAYSLPLYPRFVTSPRFMDDNKCASLQLSADRIDMFFSDGATRAALVSATEKSNASTRNKGMDKTRRSGKLTGSKKLKMPSLSRGCRFLARTCNSLAWSGGLICGQ